MVETKKCAKCGGTKYHNQGISKKNNQPYENWKCGNCKDTEWVDLRTPKEGRISLPPAPDWDKIRERREEGMEWLNAKNNAALIIAALIGKGEVSYVDYYEIYKNIAKAIYDFRETKE